jgi:hypothetical protein
LVISLSVFTGNAASVARDLKRDHSQFQKGSLTIKRGQYQTDHLASWWLNPMVAEVGARAVAWVEAAVTE